MSDHLPIYVWGRAARGALMLAGKGWGLGATMHADSLPEALDSLRSQLGATDADLAGLTIYLQYSAYLTPAGHVPTVEEAWHLRLDDDGALAPVRLGAIDGDRSPTLTGAQRLPVAADAAGRRRPIRAAVRSTTRPPTPSWPASLGLRPRSSRRSCAHRSAFLDDARQPAASATRPRWRWRFATTLSFPNDQERRA